MTNEENEDSNKKFTIIINNSIPKNQINQNLESIDNDNSSSEKNSNNNTLKKKR